MWSSSAADSAGLDAARALSGAPVRVTLIDRPQLPPVSTAPVPGGDRIALAGRCRPRRFAGSSRRQQNVKVLLAEVRGIDDRGRNGSVTPTKHAAQSRHDGAPPAAATYDYLIIATGAAHAYFGHPEWARRAPGLKTLDDALDIRRQVLLAFEAAGTRDRCRGTTAPAHVRHRRRRTHRR
jgi:NADH dehydrogenase